MSDRTRGVGTARGLWRAAAVLIAGAAWLVPLRSAAQCQDAWRDPRDLYGDYIHFSVLRNGEPVGYHRVEFRREGAELRVRSRFEVAVDVLFFTAYRFEYAATEIWRDGCLAGLRAATNDDGRRYAVSATLENGILRIDGPFGTETSPIRLYPTSHWNAGVLASQRVLNTITGRIDAVRIVDRGQSTVIVNGVRQTARQYTYTGDLAVDVWYDDDGRWVKMRFAGKDGSTIEYVCQTCRSGPAGRA